MTHIKTPKKLAALYSQERIYDWYLGAVDTRLPKDGLINLTQTRWDEQDLAGRILENEDHITASEALEILRSGGRIKRDTWVVLSLPALAGPDDILGRQPGEALCPELFPLDVLLAKKRRMDSRDMSMFQALYQQEPVPPEGALFREEYFETIETLPNNIVNQVRWWDLADTPADPRVPIEKRGAATAGVRGAFTSDYKLIIVDVKEFWKGHGDVEKSILETARSDGQMVKIKIPQDPGSAGKTVVRDYTRLLAGYDVEGIPERGDKEERARPLASWAKVNKIYLLRGEWNKRFKYVMKRFPRGKHKDIIDAASGMYSVIIPEDDVREGIPSLG